MKDIPYISTLQAFTGLLQHGYQFIYHTCQMHGTNVFLLPLLGEDILCFYGMEASDAFYDPQKFEHHDTMLRPVDEKQIETGVHTPDDAMHVRRKEVFRTILSHERIRQLTTWIARCWEKESKDWKQTSLVNLHVRAQEVLCRAACAWAGIPLRDEEVATRADDLYAMVGAVDSHRRRRSKARKRLEAWLTDTVDAYRDSARLSPKTALHDVAMYRDTDARPLSSSRAAAELIDILHPIVAVASAVTYAALALHEHPYCTERVRIGDLEYIDCFIREVHRLYPLAPFAGARVRKEFVWQGYTFPCGTLVLLDIYGTNHDGARWPLPEQFDPGRFYRWGDSVVDDFSQGGAPRRHYRAGEALTTEVLKVTLLHLTQKVRYNVPEQDLSIDLTRIPSVPKSGFILEYIGTAEASTSHVRSSHLDIRYTSSAHRDS